MKERTRVLVLTDISSLRGGFKEPDDTQSLVRMLLYANEFEIEGLIATHTTHWDGEVRPEYIREIVEAYGKVQPRLAEHDPAYPFVDLLLGVIKAGNPCDGPAYVGESHDTEGSDWIVRCALRDDSRPLWVIVWGGTTDLAQALWRMERDLKRERFVPVLSRLKIYAIGDQFGKMGASIRDRYPTLFYITAYKSMRGMYKGGDLSLVAPQWLEAHITEGHGALGAAYPIYNGGDIYGGGVKGIKEGDSPSFLYLIPNGLSDPLRPEWGNWGGRFAVAPNNPCHFFDAEDSGAAEHADASKWKAVYRWRHAYQASFQARMDWCVKPFAEANHEPQAVVDGALERTVRPGEMVRLSASGSRDADGNRLFYDWSVYPEAGTYRGELDISGADTPEASFRAPMVREAVSIHVVLTVTDDGKPPLSAYRRVIVHVMP